MLHVFFPTCQRPQSGNRVSTSLSNSGLCWTVFARNRDTAVSAEENGDLQTLICVLVARPRWCPTLSNPVPWQNWMAAYLGYTLWMKSLFRARLVMVHDTHTGRRTAIHCYLPGSLFLHDAMRSTAYAICAVSLCLSCLCSVWKWINRFSIFSSYIEPLF